jgi:hypothetical protein
MPVIREPIKGVTYTSNDVEPAKQKLSQSL